MSADPDITPPEGIRIPQTRAEVRPGEKAPAHDHPTLPEAGEPERAFLLMRELFRTVRSDSQAFNDATYHHLSGSVRQYHEKLKRQVREELENDDLLDRMLEARSYLLRRDA